MQHPEAVAGGDLLQIRLLGSLELRRADTALPPLESARAEALLTYLILHRDAPRPRQRIAFLFWPDSTEAQAQTNLRHVLHTLRRLLPDADRFLDVTPRTLRWRADAPCRLDVATFDALLDGADTVPDGEVVPLLRRAVGLWAGDLLESCYDEWIDAERSRLRRRFAAALERLAALHEARGEHGEAIECAERLLRQDPLREETYRLLMRLHAARGDRAKALHIFHVCTATLAQELDAEPSAATRAAYEALLPPDPSPATPSPHSLAADTPLVGRSAEWGALVEACRTSERGHAQLVLVSGEPGIGKTRLIEEMRQWSAHHGGLAAVSRSYAAEGAPAWGPVVAWLRSDVLRPRLQRLERGRLTELSRLLPEILAEHPGLPRPELLPESEQRQRLFDALARVFVAPAEPLLLVADDIQWCDGETLGFVHYLIRTAPEAPLLVAATARREELDAQHPLHRLLDSLQALGRCTEVPLEPLTSSETALLAERVSRGAVKDADTARLFRETEGNPLFVIEALRAGWSPGAEDRSRPSPRVQSVIAERLARLTGAARELAGVAAVIGREFTVDVLAYASGVGEETLVSALDELWRRRIIREQGCDAWDFSHERIRDVAYANLSPARRRRHHRHVAAALERIHAADLPAASGRIGRHYEAAGLPAKAAERYADAAASALKLHARVEAVELLRRALALQAPLPRTTEALARELRITTMLLTPLGDVEGYAAAGLARLQQRALRLSRDLGIEPAPQLLRSLAVSSVSGGDFTAARRLGHELRARGELHRDDDLVIEGAYVLGIAAFWRGEFGAARQQFETAVSRYRPESAHTHILRYGLDPKVVCLSRLGNALWFLGRSRSGVRARDAAMALAAEIGHAPSRATGAVFASLLALETGEEERLREFCAILDALPGPQVTRPTPLVAEAFRGYLEARDGSVDAGIATIERALAESGGDEHAPGMQGVILRLLTAACAFGDRPETGLRAAERALARGDRARLWEAEAHRLRAEFLARLDGPASDIDDALVRGLRIARRQGALALELRAAVSLLRHRARHGTRAGIGRARSRAASILARLPEPIMDRELPDPGHILEDD